MINPHFGINWGKFSETIIRGQWWHCPCDDPFALWVDLGGEA